MTRVPALCLMFATCVVAILGLFGVGTAQPPAGHAPPPGPYTQPPLTAVVPYQMARTGGDGLTADQAKRLLAAAEGLATREQADRMIELLESVDARLQSAGNQKAAPAAGRPAPLTKLQVAQAACGACHTPGKAKGDFILFAGDDRKALKPLSTREAKRIEESIESGHMPPPDQPPLTPAQKAVRW